MMLCLCPLTQGYRLLACHWLAEMLMLLRTAQRGVPHCDIRRTVEPVPGLTAVIMYQGWDGGLLFCFTLLLFFSASDACRMQTNKGISFCFL